MGKKKLNQSNLYDNFICPLTGEELTFEDDVLSSTSEIYPVIEGIPILVPSVIDFFKKRYLDFIFYREKIGHEIKMLERNVPLTSKHSKKWKKRRDDLIEGFESERREFRAIFEPFFHQLFPKEKPFLSSYRPSSPFPYKKNLYRDWSWGETENQISLSLIESFLSKTKPLTTQVWGIGYGRLLYDLCLKFPDTTFQGLDYNFFSTVILNEIINLSVGSFTEVFQYPVSIDKLTSKRKISLKTPAPKNLQLAVSNFFQSPIRPMTSDCVVTPWFCDILEKDIALTITAINRSLRVGGSWIFFGPYSFEKNGLSNKITPEELIETANSLGFDVLKWYRKDIPYLFSPDEAFKRTENVLVFHAQKKY